MTVTISTRNKMAAEDSDYDDKSNSDNDDETANESSPPKKSLSPSMIANSNDQKENNNDTNGYDDASTSNSSSDDDAFNFVTKKFGSRGGTRSKKGSHGMKRKKPNGSKLNSSSDDDDNDSDTDDTDSEEKRPKKKQIPPRKVNNKNNSNGRNNEIQILSSDDDDDSDSDIDEFQNKLAALAQKSKLSLTGNDNGDDNSSDDDDDECSDKNNKTNTNTTTSNKNNNTTNVTNTSTASSSTKCATKTSTQNIICNQKTHEISILDSDSDDEIDMTKTLSTNVNIVLAKAQKAKELLEKARKTDTSMATTTTTTTMESSPTNNVILTSIFSPSTRNNIHLTPPTSLTTPISTTKQNKKEDPPPTGPFIQLKLRTNVQSSPQTFDKKSLHGKTNDVRFRTGTKVQKVLDKYHIFYPIAKYSNVTLTFDGEKMDLNYPISKYELEDEDLIDVLIKIPNDAKFKLESEETANTMVSATSKSIAGNDTSYIEIVTRIKGGDPGKTHKYQIRAGDQFSKLVKAYRDQHGYSSHRKVILEYNGVTVMEDESPELLGMDNGCFIEICDEAERVKQLNRMPKSSSAVIHHGGDLTMKSTTWSSVQTSRTVVPPPGGICVKIRINGDDKSITSYGINMNAPFQTLMDRVYQSNKVSASDCKFQFDGQSLNPNGTPDDEDLEGDEMIEVHIDKDALARGANEVSKKTTNAQSSLSSTTAITPQSSAADSCRHIQGSTSSKSASPTKTSTSLGRGTGVPITVFTLRNNNDKKRKFKVRDNSAILSFRNGYLKYYAKKGCKSVTFYHKHDAIMDLDSTFASLGIQNDDVIVAMENGKEYQRR